MGFNPMPGDGDGEGLESAVDVKEKVIAGVAGFWVTFLTTGDCRFIVQGYGDGEGRAVGNNWVSQEDGF